MRKAGYLDEKVIALIIRDTVRGLEFLHDSKICHRDIKGQNVLISRDLTAKLVDFGVSALLNENLGKRKTVIGTPYWMAPEVIVADTNMTDYDSRCDIWSVGITAIEIAEGHPPLHKVPPMKALMVIPKNKPPTLSSSHKWTKAFHDFISKVLVKDYEQRPRCLMLEQHEFLNFKEEDKAKGLLLDTLKITVPDVVKRIEPEWHVDTTAGTNTGKGIDTLIFDDRKKFPGISKEEDYGADMKPTNNLSNLEELSEKSVVEALKARYSRDIIYTFIGDILLACNPFKPLPIYSPKFQNVFLPSHSAPYPIPHIYYLALVRSNDPSMLPISSSQSAYKDLKFTKHNQCCIIRSVLSHILSYRLTLLYSSGESGAGKVSSIYFYHQATR